MYPYRAPKEAREGVYVARRMLRQAQKELLEATGWKSHTNQYDGITRWYHPDVICGTHLKMATAVDVVMGEVEVE